MENFISELLSLKVSLPLLFTSFYFWAFFALVMAGLSLTANRTLLRNTFLMCCGVFFYFKTSGFFVLLLLFAIAFNYLIARWIAGSNRKKTILVFGLTTNILLLCYFKYSYLTIDFINQILGTEIKVVDIFAEIGNAITGEERFEARKIILPVGISFFTFQNISYIVEVYRGSVRPIGNILNYGFFVSFFPSLMSGPIIRAKEFIPQIYRPYFLSHRQFGIAIFWILNGLIKKIILSDYLAVNFVDRVFENPTMYSGFENLMGLFGYSLQIYADFSGYTDIATGVAMLMGFYLPINFNSPYKATNAGQFWKRWHISLSRWLQDYLYIPLGGNREATFGSYAIIITIAAIAILLSGSILVGLAIVGVLVLVALRLKLQKTQRKKIITNLNMMNTMLLGGLWHGASWNFMIWGGLNGIGMLIYKYWKAISLLRKTIIITSIWICSVFLYLTTPAPLTKIALVWVSALFVGNLIKFLYNIVCKLFHYNGELKISQWIETSWAVLQTFVFITFTRLFFRSGSNLAPEEANTQAWNTAKNMVSQIGGEWNFEIIPTMIYEYRSVFIVFLLGMIIHWLPENYKRRYRLSFAKMHIVLILFSVVLTIFVLYQFVSADLQKFIYFQF